MARYIDADVLCKHFKILYEHAQTNGMYNHAKLYDRAFRVVVDAPTADVVPKSEVEKFEIEIEALKIANEKMYEAFKRQAREIFEEIEKLIFGYMSAVMPPNTRAINHVEFAELKKKYTEV